jgi:quercetin dioxygenase-like cupin family protein
MERWHVPSIDASGRREPRVLFSAPECRAVVLDMRAGEQLGEHSVHERAVLWVASGEVTVEGQTCGAGTLITFAPDERHAVAAGDGHYATGAEFDAERMPANATAPPLS